MNLREAKHLLLNSGYKLIKENIGFYDDDIYEYEPHSSEEEINKYKSDVEKNLTTFEDISKQLAHELVLVYNADIVNSFSEDISVYETSKNVYDHYRWDLSQHNYNRKVRNLKDNKMNLREAKEILKKNGYMLESEEIRIDDLIAFAKLNCSKAMGAAVSVKDRCEWPLVEIDITGDAVFKKYNGICITGYFKERTGAGARRGASKYFSIFPEENKLVVGPGTSERVNGKHCRLITDEYTYNSWDDLIKFFNRNNFNTTKLPKHI